MRIFITLIFSTQLLLAQEAKPTVAILDFEEVLKMDSYYLEVEEARERIQEIRGRR